MKMNRKHDNCEFCGGPVVPKRVSKYYGPGKITAVIERVPAYVCQRCGERYYDAQVLKTISRLIKAKHRIKKKVSVPVVEFQSVSG